MSFDTQAFRQKYRAAISPHYNVWLHGGFVLAFGLTVIAFFLRQLHAVRPLEWLTVPLAIVFYSWGEYRTHRFFGHKKHPLVKMFYQRHTGDHHSFFAEGQMRYEFARDWRVILFPAWLIVLYSGGMLLGWWLIGMINANVAALFVATLLSGYLTYEILHALEHLPPENLICRLPWVRQMRRLHELHHRRELMHTNNFNIVFPLWDWIFGTLHWEAEKPRTVTMQHSVDIARSPEEVFAWVSTPRRWPEWHPYPIAIMGPEGSLRVGSRFEYAGGRAGSLQWEVMAARAGQMWQTRARGKHGLELLVTYECSGTASGTRFVRTLEYRFGSLWVRLADLLFVRKRIASDSVALLNKLREVAEMA